MLKRIEKSDNLARILGGLSSLGKSIGLAVGSFEMLRPGDIRMLEDARTRVDYLVIAVGAKWKGNKAIKGVSLRIPVKDRAEIIAGLRSVDYVTFFEEDSADKLIKQLRPSFLIYGTAWNEKTIPEKNIAGELQIPILICGGGKVLISTPTKSRSKSTR